jgi:hypothetical protein
MNLVGHIERELRLKDEARAARFEARLAAIELAAFKAEEERQRIFGERLAELRNGIDGAAGRDGKDADIEPLRKEIFSGLDKVRAFYSECQSDVTKRVNAKLAEVKDGKDGEPGRDGKDADEEAIRASLVGFLEERLAHVRDGEDGEPGLPGAPGRDGVDGKDGKDGNDGKLPIVREWTNRVHYEGDVVRHNGATYQALADTGSEPPHSDWGELASRGTDGREFVLRGIYDAAAKYKQHDIVMLNRNSFAAKYDAPGDCPGDGWQLFGPSGQRGKEGPPGAKGNDGRSVSIASLEADADAMVLRITDSLGKTFSLDLEPIAERIVEAAR